MSQTTERTCFSCSCSTCHPRQYAYKDNDKAVAGAVLVTTLAGIEDRASFVCTTQLLCIIPDLFPATLLTRLPNNGIRLHIVLGEDLDFGTLVAERRGERRCLRVRHDGLRGSIYDTCELTNSNSAAQVRHDRMKEAK